MSKSICFNGCSFTAGDGFAPTDRDIHLYDALVAEKLNLARTNIAMGGSSNHLIFMRSAQAILSKQYDIVVTQWTALNRLWLFPGPESGFFVNSHPYDYWYKDVYIKKSDYKKIIDYVFMLNHDYQNIIELIVYCNILENLCVNNNVGCVFINGLVPWTEDLFSFSGDLNFNDTLSEYARQILFFDMSTDEEMIRFLTKLKNNFQTLNKKLWLNLFDPLTKLSIDKSPIEHIGKEKNRPFVDSTLMGHHPGIESNKIFANMLKEFIINKNLLDKDNQ
jgi:hypothetical protein